jgi:hypothetical protein
MMPLPIVTDGRLDGGLKCCDGDTTLKQTAPVNYQVGTGSRIYGVHRAVTRKAGEILQYLISCSVRRNYMGMN